MLNGIMLHINVVKELVIMNIKIIYMVAARAVATGGGVGGCNTPPIIAHLGNFR